MISTSDFEQTTVRFTSIEPIQNYREKLINIAEQNDCHVDFFRAYVVNAPFCGIDYHAEEFHLTSGSSHSLSNVQSCMVGFKDLESTQLADGFFEVIG